MMIITTEFFVLSLSEISPEWSKGNHASHVRCCHRGCGYFLPLMVCVRRMCMILIDHGDYEKFKVRAMWSRVFSPGYF